PRAFTKELLEYLEIRQYVDAAFGPEDVARPKPAPDMLRAALARLRVPAAEALYIGDMVGDIESALAAGVRLGVVAPGAAERTPPPLNRSDVARGQWSRPGCVLPEPLSG